MGETVPIHLEQVCHTFGTGELAKQILFDVDFRILEGEIVILTGPSGGGKTTLLTLIGALRAAQEGSVRVLGEELLGASEDVLLSVRRRTGYIFQQHNLIDALTVRQNVQMTLDLNHEGSAEDGRKRIETALDEVGLTDHLEKHPDQLSGGQMQRVGIARALVGHPRIVLADEPTASLDKHAGRSVVDLIQRLARENGAAVILVTHDNRILDVADRIVNLEDGRIQTMREAVAANNTRMLKLLDRHDPGASRYLAAFSLSLARVAAADRVIHDKEREVMRSILTDVADLSAPEVELIIEQAMAHVRMREDTKSELPNLELESDEVEKIFESLAAVARADGNVSLAERTEIERIVAELGVSWH